jgi:Na+-transporting NADH:ubiquinone oxidoreductase subunit C
MKKYTEEIRMTSFLLLLTVICTSLLSFSNLLYQKALAVKQKELRMEILNIFSTSFTEDTFFTVFSNNVTIKESKKISTYLFRGTPERAVIITSGNGLWSIIELMIIVNIDANIIDELRVLSHGETPGLGGKIEEPLFLDQFSNLDISDGIKIVKEKKGESGEVDAITGASHTSKAVETIISRALEEL